MHSKYQIDFISINTTHTHTHIDNINISSYSSVPLSTKNEMHTGKALIYLCVLCSASCRLLHSFSNVVTFQSYLYVFRKSCRNIQCLAAATANDSNGVTHKIGWLHLMKTTTTTE